MSYACFECRKSFKRKHDVDGGVRSLPCPQCAGPAFNLGRHFKPPKKDDTAQWEKVRFLFEHGFRFQKIRTGPGHHDTVPYPKTMKEAKTFVEKYRDFAIEDSD